MTQLSLVLAVHRDQGFVRQFLSSVLTQLAQSDDPAVEIVVVDDAAPDHSAEIAASLAASGPIRLVHRDSRAGPGAARRAALQAVSGDFVWFVDVTDSLVEGGLALVLDRVRRPDAPDALVVGHRVQGLYGGTRDVDPSVAATTPLWAVVARRPVLDRVAHLLDEGAGWHGAVAAALTGDGRTEVLRSPVYLRRELPRAVRARSDGIPDVTTPPAQGQLVRRGRLAVRALRGRLRRPRRVLRSVLGLPGAAWYALQRRRPLDDSLVAYAAYWYRAYSCNPRAVYEKARVLRPDLRGVWVVDQATAARLPADVEHVLAGSRDYYRLMARAKYLVNNVNFPNDVVKRAGQVHLQTHHGTPLKTMGLDLVHSPYSRKFLNFRRLMQRVARWDYSVSQNAFTSEQWERVYPSGTYDSLETGYPRNDVLALATADDVSRARAELGLRPGQTTVLYLPTHREYHGEYVPQLDPLRLADELGPDFVLLVRAHYFYADEAGPAAAHERVVDVADHPRIEDLYLAADALVTDYSSAMFDYAVLDRPIVLYLPDWDEYRTRRGTTFDVVAEPPGAVALTQGELTEILASRTAWDDDSAAHRKAFRERFCYLDDGTAAERVVRALWPTPDGGQA